MDDFYFEGTQEERVLICEFERCGKRYSTEHSRRQHYRRHHKEEWEDLQNRRRAEKRLSQFPAATDVDSNEAYVPKASSARADFLPDNRPPPLMGSMTEPAGLGLGSYNNLAGAPHSPTGQIFQIAGAGPAPRSPLVNRARSPYTLPSHQAAKRHSIGDSFHHNMTFSPTMLSPALSPSFPSSQRSSIGDGNLSLLPSATIDSLHQELLALQTQRRAMSPTQGPVSMFGVNPLTRSRSFNDLYGAASAQQQPDLPAPQSAGPATDLHRFKQRPDVRSPLIDALNGMMMAETLSTASLRQFPPIAASSQQSSDFNTMFQTLDHLFPSAPQPDPILSSVSSFNNIPTSPLAPSAYNADPLSPVNSFPTFAAEPMSPQLQANYMNGFFAVNTPAPLGEMQSNPRLMSQFSTPHNRYQPPANYQPRRAPSLTVSGVDARERPITSISQEIAALLADADSKQHFAQHR